MHTIFKQKARSLTFKNPPSKPTSPLTFISYPCTSERREREGKKPSSNSSHVISYTHFQSSDSYPQNKKNMATSYTNIPKTIHKDLTSYRCHFSEHSDLSFIMSLKTIRLSVRGSKRGRNLVVQCCTSNSLTEENLDVNKGDEGGQFEYFNKEYGWNVRRVNEEESEIRRVAYIQSQAFYKPMYFFNDFFFEIFQGEVLSGLLYKLQKSPPNRYACLVAEASTEATDSPSSGLVGVVDVTAWKDKTILNYLPGAKEYLYVSGIAVLNSFRRRKVATALLKACDRLSDDWGFEHIVLRAYEDDIGALKLYENAGYTVVSGDPPWMSTWIGKRRRVLLTKQQPTGFKK